MTINKINSIFKDLIVIDSRKFEDNRGYFRELFKEKIIKKKMNFFVVSKSKKNVLRGLHIQLKQSQAKYVSVVKGEIFDVVVDCRPNSKTFGKYFYIILSEKNCKSILIPEGFAHGFVGMKKENIVVYGCNKYRHKNSEISIKWDDKDLNIKWPINNPILSKKDRESKKFRFYFKKK